MQKKITSLLSVLLLGMAVAGCSDDEKTVKSTEQKSSTEVKSVEASKTVAADNWQEYKVGGGLFVVRVPAKPECQEQASDGSVAKMCTTETQETGMMINATKLAGIVDPTKISEALTASLNGSAKGMGGEAVDVVDIDISGLKAKSFSIKTAQGVVPSRITIKGNYLVQVIAMPKTSESDVTKEESEKFLKSLALSK